MQFFILIRMIMYCVRSNKVIAIQLQYTCTCTQILLFVLELVPTKSNGIRLNVRVYCRRIACVSVSLLNSHSNSTAIYSVHTHLDLVDTNSNTNNNICVYICMCLVTELL